MCNTVVFQNIPPLPPASPYLACLVSSDIALMTAGSYMKNTMLA